MATIIPIECTEGLIKDYNNRHPYPDCIKRFKNVPVSELKKVSENTLEAPVKSGTKE